MGREKRKHRNVAGESLPLHIPGLLLDISNTRWTLDTNSQDLPRY